MAKYRKKPVVIEAMQISQIIKLAEGGGESWDMLPDWITKNMRENKLAIIGNIVEIDTLEGVLTGNYDDYLIQGVQGEIYACKPDIFEQTYDPVDET